MSAEGAPGTRRIASLAMYRDPPIVAEATRALWSAVRDRLRHAGLADTPDRLDESIAHDDAWLDPRLLLAQTCGYPLATRLRGRVRLVATPVYDHPGCSGAMGGSFVVVRSDAVVTTLADLRGRTAAINDWRSNSGMNVLRHAAASHSRDGRFFGRVLESGGHVASLAMIASGAVDTAAIDCVTYGNLARHAPERLAGLRILAETVKTPALPFITRVAATDAEVAMLREALFGVVRDPATAGIRDTLGLRDFAILPDNAYDAALDVEREAADHGYATLA